MACRLVPLDKNPGVRPIAIGELPRRIISKAVLSIIGQDIADATCPLQLCAGLVGGCEAAIHAIQKLFSNTSTEGILLVDAFNVLNRQAALHNISVLCPPFFQILQNTYRTSIRVVIPGNGEISSSEGTSQGDPLAMGMYALGVIPLIRTLTATCPQVHQVWYADDASGAGSCADLRVWWDALCSAGPNFGYHPNPSKTFLVTKPEHAEKAKQLFAGTNVSICAGKRCLGAAIGSKSFTEEYVRKKVCTWVEEVKSLACIAATHPHSARSVQCIHPWSLQSVDFRLKDNVGHTKPISPFGARNSRISFTSPNRPPFMLQSGT